jgi:hypothetical protein
MDTPLEETQKDGLITASADDDDPVDVTDEPSKPVPASEAPKAPKPKGTGPDGEDSYEDGWYQVLKRRADEDASEG